jgi:hypothetical protein
MILMQHDNINTGVYSGQIKSQAVKLILKRQYVYNNTYRYQVWDYLT